MDDSARLPWVIGKVPTELVWVAVVASEPVKAAAGVSPFTSPVTAKVVAEGASDGSGSP